MIPRKTYNKFYKKEFNFPIITNHDELNKYIYTQIYLDDETKYSQVFDNDHNVQVLDKYYNDLNKTSVINTIKYIFDKQKTGIYVKIENNQVSQFIILYNSYFRNDFSNMLKFKEHDVNKYIEAKSRYYKNRIPRMTNDTRRWLSTNCLLRTERDDDGPTEAYLEEFYDMLNKTCQNRKINNCIFFINRKDFPNIKPDNTEPDEHIWDSENKIMRSPFDKFKFAPIFSQSTTSIHSNLLIPTGDDWNIITQEFKDYRLPDDFKLLDWEERKPIVIWRGMSTGCGNTPDTNPRIKLSLLTQELKKKNIHYLDAGVVRFTRRDKKIYKHPFVEFQKAFDYNFKFDFVDKFEQAKYKFTINVEGNSSAYRYGSLFYFGFCIFNVESKYHVWFEQWLTPFVHYIPVKHDLSDLVEKIEWALANDDKCKQISENAKEFYNKYFNREFIYDYMQNSINAISSKYNPMSAVYDKERLINAMRVFDEYRSCGFETISNKNSDDLKNNTVIIVPFRDNKFQERKKQLELFKRHYKDYNVLIVEQSDDSRKFNRGALLNIGFKYCYKNYKYFIFHDVDILTPIETMEKYYFNELNGTVHLGHMTNKCIGCKLFFGAINKFDGDSFKKINGFPNTFWGWGDEDVVLYYRCCRNDVSMYRYEFEESERIIELEHQQTQKIKELTNITRYEKRIFDNINYNLDGLLQTMYHIRDTETEKDSKYCKICVDIK